MSLQQPEDPAARRKPALRRPRAGEHNDIEFDILEDLISFYMRCVGAELNRDLDAQTSHLHLARGTGKISTLLFVAANPGVRPSVIAHRIFKDRSAMARLLNQLKDDGLLIGTTAPSERRAHELYLTDKGQRMVAALREIAVRQSDRFFDVLSVKERDALRRMLKKLYAHLLDRDAGP